MLQAVVRIPSVTPGDRSVSDHPTYGEGRLAQFAASFMRDCGLTPKVHDVHPERPAVWARLDAGRDKTVLLQAHLDTVEPDWADADPFSGEERGGFIHGRGACDCKASLAVFLDALRAAARAPQRLRYNLIVAGVPDEEHALTGSLFLAQRLRGQADFVLCGEPTSLVPVTAHKGVLRWRVIVRGSAAHSSTPELGDNAVYRAAPLIGAIERYGAALAAADTDPDLKHATACLVEIRGGTAVNVVPGECQILVDRRLMPGENVEEAEAAFITALEAALPREHWRLERIVSHCVPLKRCPDNEFLDGLRRALAAAGLPDRPGAMHCGTDASNYASAGFMAIAWGPGELALAHTRGERVEMAEVARAAEIMAAFLGV